jgi:hypothetical protein
MLNCSSIISNANALKKFSNQEIRSKYPYKSVMWDFVKKSQFRPPSFYATLKVDMVMVMGFGSTIKNCGH